MPAYNPKLKSIQSTRGMDKNRVKCLFLNQRLILSSFVQYVCGGVAWCGVKGATAFTRCKKNIRRYESQTMHVKRESTLCLINSIHSGCGPSISISSFFFLCTYVQYSVIFEGKVSPLIVIEFKVIRIDFFSFEITITKCCCYILEIHSII